MSNDAKNPVIPDESISGKIYFIRGRKVMLDEDLAELYGVTTGNLNKAVKRNANRFPDDFMFILLKDEYENLIFRFGISKWGGRRKLPYAFTEQGVAMLSGVLHSERAIKVNIQIMRVFTRMRELLETHIEIIRKLDLLERKEIEHDDKLMLIFEYLKQLEAEKHKESEQKNRPRIGFKVPKSD